MQGWLTVKNGYAYANVSERTFRTWLKKGGLRHVRPRHGPILIYRQWIDQFLFSYEVENEVDKIKIDKIVEETCEEFS